MAHCVTILCPVIVTLVLYVVDVLFFQSLGAGGKTGVMMRSPSAIKTMLLEWCKAMTREYIDVCKVIMGLKSGEMIGHMTCTLTVCCFFLFG